MSPQELCGNDIWVFQALAGRAGERWPLVDVISHADALNHAVLSYAELCRAVARLRALGLVEVEGGKCGLSESGLQLVNSCGARGFLACNDNLGKRLGAGPWEPREWDLEPPQDEQFVTREQYEAALHQYQRRY